VNDVRIEKMITYNFISGSARPVPPLACMDYGMSHRRPTNSTSQPISRIFVQTYSLSWIVIPRKISPPPSQFLIFNKLILRWIHHSIVFILKTDTKPFFSIELRRDYKIMYMMYIKQWKRTKYSLLWYLVFIICFWTFK